MVRTARDQQVSLCWVATRTLTRIERRNKQLAKGNSTTSRYHLSHSPLDPRADASPASFLQSKFPSHPHGAEALVSNAPPNPPPPLAQPFPLTLQALSQRTKVVQPFRRVREEPEVGAEGGNA